MSEEIINFSIIAHVDHGKTEIGKSIIKNFYPDRSLEELLDNLNVEKNRQITIKSKCIKLIRDNITINLIDTPGHMDFISEVHNSLRACENALLVVDASKGLQSQTLEKISIAKEYGINLIPVINKIDLPNKKIEEIKNDLIGLNINIENLCLVSAKTKEGIDNLIKTIIEKFKRPLKSKSTITRALIIDSLYHQYDGCLLVVKVVEGILQKGKIYNTISNKIRFTAHKIGYYRKVLIEKDTLEEGDIGYVITHLKHDSEIVIGDTISGTSNASLIVPIINKPKLVFSIFYTEDNKEEDLKKALEKIRLNDNGLDFIEEYNIHFGKCFKCGFCGILHMETVKARLKDEYNIVVLSTIPNVEYRVKQKSGEIKLIADINLIPDEVLAIEEPIVECVINTYSKYYNNIIELIISRRGYNTNHIEEEDKLIIKTLIPLAEIITDFNDKLQSVTNGFASYSYSNRVYIKGDLVKLIVLANKQVINLLTLVVHKDNALKKARLILEKLPLIIRREQFKISIQVCINNPSKIIASDQIRAYKKDVVGEKANSGGDITRKLKLKQQQADGKKRLDDGNIHINKSETLNLFIF